MSITLIAYPTAFLINPQNAKDEKLSPKQQEAQNLEIATGSLRFIRVLTNIRPVDVKRLMVYMPQQQEIAPYTYKFQNGLIVKWNLNQRDSEAILFGHLKSDELQNHGEDFFKKLDEIAGENVRLINNSSEYFYYNYETEYTTSQEICAALEQANAQNIYHESSSQVKAHNDGKNIRYYKEATDEKFTLEVEQKITIQNFAANSDSANSSISNNALQSLKIKTNIKAKELKDLLKTADLMYYVGNSQTPLKTYGATLNWVLEGGSYSAEFTGPNIKAIKKEAEEIFKKMNIAAKRDLRYTKKYSTITYTYQTNYTDKGVLINTLTEHGATNLEETDSNSIQCSLFGMGMKYYQQNSNSAYMLEITQVSNKDECMNTINNLNDEYGLNIQEMTYNKIKERLEQENLHLEDETVLEDNSIVLTIDVG